VEGEITQFNITPKGGVNIVIKDPEKPAILNLSGYAPWVEGVKLINVGMKIIAYGKPSLWSQAGRFSLQVFKVVPQGEGALKEAYEKLKTALQTQGLFDESRKRPLPQYISKIALITAKGSAAESDFVKIIRESGIGIDVDFYPVQVQGKYSESEILSTLKNLPDDEYDSVVLIRGGGSLEDLITFNSEPIARAIFSSKIPVIVGVGHEKDESIADFVADVRASTPSQAAYYIISNNQSFLDGLDMLLDKVGQDLSLRISKNMFMLDQEMFLINQRLSSKVQTYVNSLDLAITKLDRLPRELAQSRELISSLERLVHSYNPKAILKRGYSLVKSDQGKVVTSVNSVQISEKINIILSDGEIKSNILSKKENHEKYGEIIAKNS